MKKILLTASNGVVFGGTFVIPGVSSGTIAVILKFFDRLIESVSGLLSDFKRSMAFLIPLGLGAACGLVGFAKLIKPALEYYPFQTSIFIVGLMLGGIPMLFRLANKNGFKKTYLISLIAAFVFISVLAVLQKPYELGELAKLRLQSGEIIASWFNPESTPMISGTAAAPSGLFDYLYLVFTGTISSAAMVIPGVSGSFMMILLGEYYRILTAVSGLTSPETLPASLLTLLPVAIGIVAGVFLVAKLLEFLMKKHHSHTYYAILGLVIGSVFVMLYTPKTYHSSINGAPIEFGLYTIIAAVFLAAAGFALTFFLGRKGEK
ncbi:MAG: DUF368 domain-containing protein [Oscillospiraceae bacterium]|nr:DUF368 domain-containing protein [Oscillospiraceae bacterium]